MVFGSLTGIILPRETTGLIPTKEWKKKRNGQEWQLGETLSCVIGQSYVLVTSLQLALAYAAIANNGNLYKPYIVKEIFSNSGEIKQKYAPELITTLGFNKKTLNIVKRGLFEVVNSNTGTARWYKGRGIRMSGKTGTSQVVRLSAEKLFSKCEEYEYKHRNHGLFAAYAPSDDPKIAVAVIVEHGCHGSSAGAPVARAVITKYMEKYYPDLRKQYMAQEYLAHLRLKKRQRAKKDSAEE